MESGYATPPLLLWCGWGGRAIAKLQPTTQLNLNGSLRTTAEDHQAIKLLVTNANAREQAANLVARIPAIPSQRAAKAEWVSGIREGVRLDVETADAVFTILSGDPTAGRRELDSRPSRTSSFKATSWWPRRMGPWASNSWDRHRRLGAAPHGPPAALGPSTRSETSVRGSSTVFALEEIGEGRPIVLLHGRMDRGSEFIDSASWAG